MNDIEKLTELFTKFPGIGSRQARRFVHFILVKNKAWRNEFIQTIQSLENTISQCSDCMRYSAHKDTSLCAICSNQARQNGMLMVVEKDQDIDSIEKSGEYKGVYFVLNGTIPISNTKRVYARDTEFYTHVKNKKQPSQYTEIILALSATPDGEYTAEVLRQNIKEFNTDTKISLLGRGLSTGSEIEYADGETIKNAFKNRF